MYISNNQALSDAVNILYQHPYLNRPVINKIHLFPILRHVLELFFSIFLIIILFPVFALVSIIIFLSSKGGIFYSQVRVGVNGKEFSIYKFRTMISGAENSTGPVYATKHDSRVTWFGNILRKTHFDEFPQLLNIVFGQMSFIGPRPERPCFVEEYNSKIENYKMRSLVKPGITGLAQICLSYDSTAYQKIDFDLMYLSHKNSLILNLFIIYYTIKKMFFFRTYDGIL